MSTFEVITNTVAPALGAVLANLLFLGPYAAIRAARKAGNLGPVNPILFPFILANCLGYLAYGFVLKDPYVILANLIGVNIALFYLITAFRLSKCKLLMKRLEIITLVLTSFWTVLGTVVVFIDDVELQEALTGYCALAMTLCMFAAPLSTIKQVIKERNTISINKGFLVMQLLNCTMWCTYGIVIQDMSILIGNVAGLLFGVIQAFLVLTLPRNAILAMPLPVTQPLSNKEVSENLITTDAQPQGLMPQPVMAARPASFLTDMPGFSVPEPPPTAGSPEIQVAPVSLPVEAAPTAPRVVAPDAVLAPSSDACVLPLNDPSPAPAPLPTSMFDTSSTTEAPLLQQHLEHTGSFNHHLSNV